MKDISPLLPWAGTKITKMTGTGNDFVLIDNREAKISAEVMPLLAEAVCCRRRSVGADGLIILSPSDRVDERCGPVDFKWDFYNADGSSAEMCGNGGRCAARFAFDNGLAGKEMVFDTLAGPIRAWIMDQEVKLEMIQPFGAYRDVTVALEDREFTLDGVNTGVPHAVLPVEDIESTDVTLWGRAIRYHEHFSPQGTNANFAQAKEGVLLVRTYERGVEDETLACGTGVTASALVAGWRGWLKSPVRVRVRSGEWLTVYFTLEDENITNVFLQGAASYVFTGLLNQEAFDWLKS
jgi:diaminopimelate epimerase